MVRPWKLSFKVTMVERPVASPYLRAALSMHSLASAPELEKNTFRMPVRSQSISARRAQGSA